MSFVCEDAEDICAICHGSISEKASCISCESNPTKHIFHCECIAKWSDQKEECPICRGNLVDHFEGVDDMNHVWFKGGINLRINETLNAEAQTYWQNYKNNINLGLIRAISNLDLKSVKILVEKYNADVNCYSRIEERSLLSEESLEIFKNPGRRNLDSYESKESDLNPQILALPPLQFLILRTFPDIHTFKDFEDFEIFCNFVREMRKNGKEFRMKDYNPTKPKQYIKWKGEWIYMDDFPGLKANLDLCARNISSRQQIAEFLLSHGANPNWTINSVKDMLDWALLEDQFLQSSIIQSIMFHDVDMVKLMIKYDAKLEDIAESKQLLLNKLKNLDPEVEEFEPIPHSDWKSAVNDEREMQSDPERVEPEDFLFLTPFYYKDVLDDISRIIEREVTNREVLNSSGKRRRTF